VLDPTNAEANRGLKGGWNIDSERLVAGQERCLRVSSVVSRQVFLSSKTLTPRGTTLLRLWPAVWTMGNLGRAAYGGTLDGMWPYSYDSCDVGTLKNQTLNGGSLSALSGFLSLAETILIIPFR
jgi:hypothetical protein